jgi:uncharacterized protein YxjI
LEVEAGVKVGDRSPVNPGSRRYIMRQKMVSIGNDYWIENDQGQQVYKIDGKIGLHKTFIIEDPDGKRLARIHKVLVTIKETMQIEGPKGEKLAVVKKDLFTPLKEHFVVEVINGSNLEIHGNILDHEYSIEDGYSKVAQVSKKLFHVRDSYSILIEPGQDDVFILAVVVCIDEMTHAGN